ncbi:MAG: type IV pilus assembly protein PilM [Solirubrobacterales bacterium]
MVGLDLEAGTVAATEIQANGSVRVTGAGVVPLPSGVIREGEVVDPEQLTAALKRLFAENNLSKTVRLGIANQRVVVRTLQLPALEKREEIETAIRFQAQDQIPMPLEQASMEWQVIERTTGASGEATMEVIVVAARREMVSSLVGAMRKAGLQPVGIDLSAFGMIRALVRESGALDALPSYEERMAGLGDGAEAPMPAAMYCNLGDATNLAVARGGTCLFTRVAQFGVEGIAQRLSERAGLTLEHSRQWLVHVGLTDPVEGIEGDPETIAATREVLGDGALKLVDELRLSLEYYGAQDLAAAVETIVACGIGTTIPGLTERVERELGRPVTAPRPQALGHLDNATAARLTLSYGLAVEG